MNKLFHRVDFHLEFLATDLDDTDPVEIAIFQARFDLAQKYLYRALTQG